MPEFTLKRKPAKTLKINIDDQAYYVPLGGSLTKHTSKRTKMFIILSHTLD